jgi:calcineurin-like phosphoesterase family protein
MKNIWFSGCSHYGHANIISLCSRDFNNIVIHDQFLIENHNKFVSNEDDYYHLGDFAYRCSAEYATKILKSLNFKTMYLILGNHSKPIRQAIQRGFLDVYLNSKKLIIFGGMASIEDPTISISKEINIDGQKIFLSHYALKTWAHAFRGSWMLYSHSHGKINSLYKSMDVGIDTFSDSHNKFTPYSFLEIKYIMDSRNGSFNEEKNNC